MSLDEKNEKIMKARKLIEELKALELDEEQFSEVSGGSAPSPPIDRCNAYDGYCLTVAEQMLDN